MSRVRFGDLVLVDSVASPVRVSRNALAADGEDIVGVQLVLGGAQRVGRGPEAHMLSAGQAMVWDSTRDLDTESLQLLRKRTLLLPGPQARQLLPHLDQIVGRPLPARLAAVRLLRSFLSGLAVELPELDAPGRDAAARATYELLRGALASTTPSPDAALRSQIETYIERHLADPTLSPPTIARANAVSVRRLHGLYSDSETVAARVRRRRLERCKEDLTSTGGTVTEVAIRWGFRNVAHFSAAFTQRFGRPPSNFRTAAGG